MVLARKTDFKSQPLWIKQGIALGNNYHYRQQKTLIHNSLNIGILIGILAFIIGLFYLGAILNPFVYLPCGAMGFGLAYFMLFILVVHEASHNMFVRLANPQQTKIGNRLFGWLVCFPFGIEYIKHWEIGHQIHHSYPVTNRDPQNCPETVYTESKLFKYLAKVLLIPGYAILRIDYSCPAEREYGNNYLLTLGSAVIWLMALGWEGIVLGWQVAIASFLGIQILVVLNTIKIAIEHGGAIGRRDNFLLRSSSSFFPLRRLLMPFNISLHFEHHLNPAIPWYELMAYHQQLEKIIPPELYGDTCKFNREVWEQINEQI